jgi:predicted MPP superfamily phosphohydrolase
VKITRRTLLRVGAAVGTTGLAGAGYVFGIEPIWIRTVQHEVPVRDLDERLEGFRIVQLSDLHVGAGVPLDYLQEAMDRAVALKPDIIVVTGDFVHRGGVAENADVASELIRRLRAPLGVFGVLGNHDHGVYNSRGEAVVAGPAILENGLAAAGMRVLHNAAVTVTTKDGATIRVAGYADLWSGGFRPDAIARDTTQPTIALCHNPDTAPTMAARTDCALLLCGHTHGGQVSIPFMGPPILPVRHREYAAGPYDVGAMRLYVNRGVGWIKRVRLFVRPEVTLHVLHRKTALES